MDPRRQVDEERLDRIERQGMFGSWAVSPWMSWESDSGHRVDGSPNHWMHAVWVVGVVGVVATLGWVVYAWVAQGHYVNTFVRIPDSVGESVEIADTGVYTVWTTPALTDDFSLDVLNYRPQAELTFVGPEDGDPVSVDLVLADTTVDYKVDGSREGFAVGTIEFPEAGTYTLTHLEFRATNTDLALGEGDGMPVAIVQPALRIALASAAVFAVVLALAVRLHRRRLRSVSRLMETLSSQGPND